MKNMVACFRPIGVVEKGVPRPDEHREKPSRYAIVSRIRVFDEYAEGLLGLDEYSHAIIVYWLHEESRVRLRFRPWNDPRLPEVGIFATRFPSRPNPIAITVVEIVRVEPPILDVRGLDAWTGTPVLDIKPYDYYDVVRQPRVPQWLHERWEKAKREKRYDEIAPWLGPCKCRDEA